MTDQNNDRQQTLDEAIDAYESSANLEDRKALIEFILHQIRVRYIRSGHPQDLEQAIEYLQAALNQTPSDEPKQAAVLTSLGKVLLEKYQLTGYLSDTEQAIEYLQAALNLIPSDEPKRASVLAFLGNAYRERAARSGHLQDLEQAIEYLQAALNLTPSDAPKQAAVLTSLGKVLLEKYQRSGSREDFDSAIDLYNEAMLLVPTVFPEQKTIFSILRNSLGDHPSLTHLTLFQPDDKLLTPEYLSSQVNPWLKSIAIIQNAIDELHGHEPREIKIVAITSHSPISISLQGGAEALDSIKEIVTPWRREHAKTMARLQEQAKQVEIELARAEILEKRAQADKERVEAQRQREEVERLRLENEKLRIELQRKKIQVALDLLTHVTPGLPETEKIVHLIKLLPALDILILSDLQLKTG